jgi:hypothetical protein
MSDVLKLEIPLGDLFRNAKLKRKSSFQALNNDETIVKKSENNKLLDNIQIIANRFTTIKRLGSGGFGEVGFSIY